MPTRRSGQHFAPGRRAPGRIPYNPRQPARVPRVVNSTQNGNWSSAATWGGLTPPGLLDTAIINNTVTLDVPVTCGQSPPPTPDGAASYDPSISTSTGASTCNLPTGTYSLCYSEIDAQGRESYRGIESWNGLTFTNGSSKVRVTFPARPAGIVSRNLYLTNTNGAYGSARLYATGITGTTYDVISASWVNGTLTYANAPGEPAGAQAVRVNSGGVLNLASTLTARGDVSIQQGGAISLGNDSVLELDSSYATLPATTPYRIWIGNTNGSFTAVIGSTSILGHRSQIRSNAGGANGSIAVPYNDGASALASSTGLVGPFQYTDFVRLGSASIDAIASNIDNSNFYFDFCTFQGCGNVHFYATFNTSPTNLRFNGCTWTGSTGTNCLQWARGSSTGTDVLDHAVFDIKPRLGISGLLSITNCYFGSGFDQPSSLGGGGGWGTFRNNFVRQIDNGGIPWSGNVDRCYVYVDAVAGANPHVMIMDTAAPGDSTLSYIVSEFGGTDDTGDWLYAGSYNYNMHHCLLLPNSIGKGSFSPVNMGNGGSGEASVRTTCDHNTWFVGSSPFLLNDFGIGSASHLIASLRSNIMWSQPGNTDTGIGPGVSNRKIVDLKNTLAQQIVDPIQLDGDSKPKADYNCGWGLQGSVGSDYYIDQATGGASLGAHDRDCDPGFDVQYSGGALTYWRNLAQWAVHRGSVAGTYAGQVADALSYIQANPELAVTDSDSAWSWVRKGFQPRNTLLYAAGHDGATIGAVDFDGPGTFRDHPRKRPGVRWMLMDAERFQAQVFPAVPGNASATAPTVTLSAPAAAATGDGAAGALGATVTVQAPAAAATGTAAATAAATTVTLTPTPGAAAGGDGAASAAASTVTVQAPAASATGDGAASATAPTVTINAPAAVAAVTVFGNAAAPTVTISAPAATATGDAAATAAAGTVTLGAPAASAQGNSAQAAGPTVTVQAPTGVATGDGAAAAAGPTVTLGVPAALVTVVFNVAGPPAVTVQPPVAAAGGTAAASAAAPVITVRAPSAVAVGDFKPPYAVLALAEEIGETWVLAEEAADRLAVVEQEGEQP